jgi:AraC-like DNA-binding protein
MVNSASVSTWRRQTLTLVQRRLQMARKRIAESAALADAAQASGFADQSHMTRLFIRTYGVSPGVYAAAMN